MSSGTTTLRKRPYPELTDAPVVAADIQALAESTDTAPTFGVGTLANRPSSGMAAGDIYFVSGDPTPSNNGITFQYDGAKWVCPHSMADGRIGEVREYVGTEDPVDPDGVTRWVLADGRPLSRTGYPVAFALCGETWGAGDGSTTFNIPDRRGRVAVGAGQGSGLTARTLAATGGEETHALSQAELATHRHTFGSAQDRVPGTRFTGGLTWSANSAVAGTAVAVLSPEGSNVIIDALANTDGAGDGAAHNNMQPFVGMNFIVRVQ